MTDKQLQALIKRMCKKSVRIASMRCKGVEYAFTNGLTIIKTDTPIEGIEYNDASTIDTVLNTYMPNDAISILPLQYKALKGAYKLNKKALAMFTDSDNRPIYCLVSDLLDMYKCIPNKKHEVTLTFNNCHFSKKGNYHKSMYTLETSDRATIQIFAMPCCIMGKCNFWNGETGDLFDLNLSSNFVNSFRD